MVALTDDMVVRRGKHAEYQRKWRLRNLEKCRAWDRARGGRHTPESRRREKLKSRYGISPEQYDEMLKRQGGVCAVCEKNGHTKHPLHVDHDHETGQVRALLCAKCNIALGSMDEDADRIKALAAYIEMWRP